MNKVIEKIRKDYRIILFMILIACFSFCLFMNFFGFGVNEINATMMAFTYEYGFISRGLLGTIYNVFDSVIVYDMLSYDGVYGFTLVITILYVVVLLLFYFLCLKKVKKTTINELMYCILFFTIFAVPMFAAKSNFGRLDIYCFMLSLLAAMVLIYEKAEWLVVVFSALGVVVHQGNVFMYLNIILILLLYKAFSYDGKKRNKYIILFVLSFLSASILFLYFEFFSHYNGENILESIVSDALLLCKDGDYHEDVIDHEILGIDLSSRERMYMKRSILQLAIFIPLFSPYLFLGVKFFKTIIKNSKTKLDKWKYIIITIGTATLIPEFLLKCDYGRWIFAFVSYYCVVMFALLAMHDEVVENTLVDLIQTIQSKYKWSILLLAYPIILQPLIDVGVCWVTSDIANEINNMFLHWW